MKARASKLKPVSAKNRALPPSVVAERSAVMHALQPVVQLIGCIAGPNVEIVLHDLCKPENSVVGIANGHVTGRILGSSILSGPKDDKGFSAAKRELTVRGLSTHSLVEEYPTENAAGQRLRSATVIFRDGEGEPFAALCLNADMSMFEAAHTWLERLLKTQRLAPPAPAKDQPQMDVLTEEIISDAVRTFGKPIPMMSKEEKIHAVQVMLQRGLFMVRGGVERAATALHVTRFTIYNYLEELRGRSDVPDADAKAASIAPVANPKPKRVNRKAVGSR